MQSFDYIHIEIKGFRGLFIEKISHDEALEIIDDNNLNEIPASEYDPSLGKIYTTPKFKRIVNSRPHLKRRLLTLLNKVN